MRLQTLAVFALSYVALVFEGSVLFGRLWNKLTGQSFDPLAPAVSAIWAAPFAVFQTAHSAWAPLLAALPAAALTLRFRWRIGHPMAQKFAAHVAGVAVQLAIVAFAIELGLAAGVLCIAAAVLSAARWANDHDEPRAMWRTLATVTLLVTVGLLQYHLTRGGAGNTNVAAAPRTFDAPADPASAEAGAELDDSHIGVILLPEPQPHTMLVAPLPALGKGWKAMRDPLSIPFYGAYWFYKAPHRRPPPNSHVVHGKASETSFRSTDRRPLLMEARQNLGVFFESSCCGEIRVEVSNADRYPGTVEMEISLSDSVGHQAVSLGRQTITSTPRWRPGRSDEPSPEVLRFAMPHPVVRFDEFLVRFHLHQLRSGSSAKIAIERFLLAP